MPKILIVDDEPDILFMLRVNLEGAGYDTALAGDGDVALQRIDQEPFDLVLLDVMMPVLDGWGVLRGLADRRTSGRTTPPVIVVSAKAAHSEIARAIELGAADYVVKPFDLDDLLDRIRACAPSTTADQGRA